jgi:Ricin-type beta-trefoil lectin domain-like
MTSGIRQQQSDSVLTIRNVWMEGKAPTPLNPVSIYETNINTLVGLFLGKGTSILLGLEGNATRPVSIVNKLSGMALAVEDSSTDQGARIQQVTRNDGAANQRWFIKFIKHAAVPGVIFHQVHRYWLKTFAFPRASYSVIVDHNGLCLDIVNASTDGEECVQKFPLKKGRSHLWAFVPEKKGFNFIVNLCSGRVLDVEDSSLKNYATVRQHPFNDGDSQRWQIFR